MMELCEAKAFIERMSWPDGSKPLLRTQTMPPVEGIPTAPMQATLYRPEAKWPATKTAQAPTLEGALEVVLYAWVTSYKLPTRLLEPLRQLTN